MYRYNRSSSPDVVTRESGMPTRSNALTEVTRLWLQTRHGCLVDESVPVPVKYGLSDLDLVAIKPDLTTFKLPNGVLVGPRLIVETKDEHDWEPTGKDFGNMFEADVKKMGDQAYIPTKDSKGTKFTMLREEHFAVASKLFGTKEFERLFVVHNIQLDIKARIAAQTHERSIYIVTAHEVVGDLLDWYRDHPRKAALRNTLTGDLWHLLIGYCSPLDGRN
jgi:hypothetical protein